MYEYDYLMHYGIARKSGRYPWGSGERPYQGDNISTKKKRGLFSFRKNRQNKKIEKDLKKLSKEEYEEQKRAVLKTGTATEVLMFKHDLTSKEMQDAISRIQLERQLSSISKQEMDDSWNAVNRAMKKVGDAKNWAKTALEIYDMVESRTSKSSKGSNSNKN